jgi:hypothetical protein
MATPRGEVMWEMWAQSSPAAKRKWSARRRHGRWVLQGGQEFTSSTYLEWGMVKS